MKVIIFGATGAVGSRTLKSCLTRNYTVTAFVRSPSKLPSDLVSYPNLTIVQGDAADSQAVTAAIEGHDAVIQSAAFGSNFVFPWSNRTGSDLSEEIVRTVVDAAVQVQKKRSAEGKSPLRVWAVSGLVLMDHPLSHTPKRPMSDLLPFFHPETKVNWNYFKENGATLDWSLLCPGMIRDGDPRGPLEVSIESPKGWQAPWLLPGRLPFVGTRLNIFYNFSQLAVTFGTLGEFLADNLGPGEDYTQMRVAVFEK
ncbi:hypothetical protein DL96DRAFT_1708875 [Flagelloscypha sp. PMI_526]|nr:hypothetical protein DL96DRAFT_1708875 [Flagelloscypha sp. PMI_526]